jgi:hypothetical protein
MKSLFANNYMLIYPSTILYSTWANRTGIISPIKSLAHIILNSQSVPSWTSKTFRKSFFANIYLIYYISKTRENTFHKITLQRFYRSPTIYRYNEYTASSRDWWIPYWAIIQIHLLCTRPNIVWNIWSAKDHHQMTQSKHKHTTSKPAQLSQV